MARLTRHAIAAIFTALAFQAAAVDNLPPPVNGITFEEWAAANARLASNQPRIQGKLATYEDYVRVQAHLTVASEARKEPQEVLKEHALNVYELSQETRPWVQKTAEAAGSGDGSILEMNRIRRQFEAEYREKYGLSPVEDKD